MARPVHDLQTLLGEPAFVALAEAFGGTRLYVPSAIRADDKIATVIGVAKAKVLSARLAPDVIVVPLARELRARHYRAAGHSNAQIARRLGITETAVEKLFKRVVARGDAPPARLPLFPDA